MKLELKNIKHTSWASEETHCYQASLYVDGKPVAIVSNDGHGGADRDYPHPKFKGDYRAQMRDVSRYFSGLRRTAVTEWSPEGMEQCLEFWCADQVNDWLSARELKRMMRTQILFQKEGEEEAGVFGTKYYPSKTDGNFWRGRRILNDMPFDEALSIWKETAL